MDHNPPSRSKSQPKSGYLDVVWYVHGCGKPSETVYYIYPRYGSVAALRNLPHIQHLVVPSLRTSISEKINITLVFSPLRVCNLF